MAIRIAQKYEKSNVNKKKTAERKLNQKLTYVILDMLCSYLVSSNRNIKMKGYKNIKELFDILDVHEYKSDADIERMDYIRFALDARIVYGIMDADKVKDYVLQKDTVHCGRYNINFQELSNKEVEYVNTMVTNLIDTATFSSYIDRFAQIKTEFDNASAYEKSLIVDNWKSYVRECNNHIRNTEVDDTEKEFVSLRDGVFEDYARDTYAYVTNPSSKLSTGMTGMNYLLGGGFENGRVYGFFGLQGEGKSLTLLNLAYQIKLYNKKFKTKDPTKQPAVVYLTLENTKRESFTRLFSMVTGQRMNEVEVDEGIQMMKDKGLVVNDENPIDMIIKYCPSNSVDTGYLYDLADDLEEAGYEVICYIIDYINVIRSIDSYRASEERLRLGSVINEMKTIASDMDIPIITAGQLNREANRKVDEARERGNLNLLPCIDRSNLGESMLILNNLDGAFIITPTRIPKLNEKYLSIKLVKYRWEPYTKPLNYSYGIYHPYDNIDSINLTSDVGMKEPLFKLDLSFKNVECEVDENIPLPDNSKRAPTEPLLDGYEAPKASNPIVLNSDGTKPFYDTFWRTNPQFINGITNINGQCPEVQMRTLKRKEMGNIMCTSINSLNGISRYSDDYTRLYDPKGSKEERLAHDYNIKYNATFGESDFPMLYSHFMMMKNGEIPDTDKFVEPTKTYEVEPGLAYDGIFTFVPRIDHQAYMKYVKTLMPQVDSAASL